MTKEEAVLAQEYLTRRLPLGKWRIVGGTKDALAKFRLSEPGAEWDWVVEEQIPFETIHLTESERTDGALWWKKTYLQTGASRSSSYSPIQVFRTIDEIKAFLALDPFHE